VDPGRRRHQRQRRRPQTAESRSFTLEQAVLWDPDILIVTDPRTSPMCARHAVLSRLRAAEGGRSVQLWCRWARTPGRTAPPSSR
jgi:hypothetical protein